VKDQQAALYCLEIKSPFLDTWYGIWDGLFFCKYLCRFMSKKVERLFLWDLPENVKIYVKFDIEMTKIH